MPCRAAAPGASEYCDQEHSPHRCPVIRKLHGTVTRWDGEIPPKETGIGRKEMFYLMTHSTHFIYNSDNLWHQTYG